MNSQYTRGILMTVLAAIVWSTGGVLVKLISLDAFTILFFRSLYAGIFFLIVFRSEALKFDSRVLIVSLCYAPLLICFVCATKMTTAANAIFLQYISPAVVLFVEPRLLKTKMLNYNIITVIVCTFGLSFFLFGQNGVHHWLGDGLALLSGFFSAALILSLKVSNKSQQMSGILLGNIWVVLITLPWFLKSTHPSLNENLMLAFLGFIQIGLGYLLFTYGQRRIPAIESSLIALLEPILNPIWVLIGYHEMPSLWSWIGGSIIILTLFARMLYLKYSNKVSLL
ncbi:MAG: DMT family transporter [Saprospiraceae bacterium]|uniref:DMT family transporter n=1 Tax=Candidatus Opimibacter skivensis TaxID=2982028 RepID=A0A9D7XPD5_9BACT|nr:DMT family transporter [Candidatus Opimibacter skivensis]